MSRRNRSRATPHRGRTIALIGGLASLVLVVLAYVWLQPTPARVAADPNAAGRLVASSSTVDLGRVPFDQLAEARFELANTGSGTVHLVGNPKVQMLEGC